MPMKTCPVESPWLHRRRMNVSSAPVEMRDWLLDPASLTGRLRAVCAGRFTVEVLAQGWSLPRSCEALELGVPPGRYGLVRQVYLRCDQAAWVYARTVIPAATLRGPERRLGHLKARPLGAVLFSNPTLRRTRVTIERLVPGDVLYAAATHGAGHAPQVIWGRRSLFMINCKTLMVSEYFLPGILPCKQ